ncbi:hypothetical protein ACFL41_00010 [Gemmatimonadota bacterium]
MSAPPLTTRLPEWLDQEIREFFKKAGLGVSTGMKQITEEWWIMRNMPSVEIRDGVTGPRAALKDGPDIWQIIMVKEGYGDDLQGLSEHFGDLPMEDIETALAFYRLFPEQIDAKLRENEQAMHFLMKMYG